MLTKASTALADGVKVEDLIDVANREVSMRMLSDREIYELELERVFGRTWLLLAHETEIPKPGDFVVRDMGEDQVIVTRDRSNQVNVLLNLCPHRGMRVCMTDNGNAAMHRCIYHGWAFRPDGSFIGAPIEREQMHGNIRTKDELGLKKARVELYGGLVFATWSEDGPSLEEFFGESKFYFDMLLCRTDGGLEVLGPPQRLTVDANWKTAAEQSASDGFHTLTLHRSLMEIGQMGSATIDDIYASAPGMYGVDISCDEGHSLRCIPAETTFSMVMGSDIGKLSPEERLKILPPPGITQELLPQLQKHLSTEQMRLLALSPPQVGGIFPNVGVLFIYAPGRDGKFVGALALHAFMPKGPDKFEFYTWLFAEKDTPADVKRAMRVAGIYNVGTTGTIEQDDADTWPHMSRNAKGVMGRQQTLKYQAITGHNKPEGWPGGGHVYNGFTKDDTQWNWWLAYRRQMVE